MNNDKVYCPRCGEEVRRQDLPHKCDRRVLAAIRREEKADQDARNGKCSHCGGGQFIGNGWDCPICGIP